MKVVVWERRWIGGVDMLTGWSVPIMHSFSKTSHSYKLSLQLSLQLETAGCFLLPWLDDCQLRTWVMCSCTKMSSRKNTYKTWRLKGQVGAKGHGRAEVGRVECHLVIMFVRLPLHRSSRLTCHASCLTFHASCLTSHWATGAHVSCLTHMSSVFVVHAVCSAASEDGLFWRRKCPDFAFTQKKKEAKETEHMVPRAFFAQRIKSRISPDFPASCGQSWWRTLFQLYKDVVQYLQYPEVTCAGTSEATSFKLEETNRSGRKAHHNSQVCQQVQVEWVFQISIHWHVHIHTQKYEERHFEKILIQF